MKDKITLFARILLGLILVLFGLNFFFSFLPPPKLSEEGMQFMGALFETGYMFPVLGVVKLAVGLCLLTNRFMALALVVFAPVAVNIILFHLFLDLPGIGPGLIVFILTFYLMLAGKEKYNPLLSPR